MTRQSSSDAGPRFKGEDDEPYRAILVRPKTGFVKKGDPAAEKDYQRKDAILVEFEVAGHDNATDLMGLGLGLQSATKQPSRLRQLLNALAEHDRDDDLWFDNETLEWGYDLDGDDNTPPAAKLVPGMLVIFRGENRKGENGSKQYRITAYKSAAKK